LTPPIDPAHWEWVAPGLGEADTVSAVVPRGFEDCARIDHADATGDDGAGLPTGLLRRLVLFLGALTKTPDRACFAIWEGYGWNSAQLTGPRAEPPRRRWRRTAPDPFADATDSLQEAREALTAELSSLPEIVAGPRRYRVLSGPVDAVLRIHDPIAVWSRRVPELWWPVDRRWFVGSGPELTWTYLAGRAEMVDILLEGWPDRTRRVGWNDPIR
jgi:hypothetical protein